MEVGDVITQDKDVVFRSMKAGSVIKIIRGGSRGEPESFVMRLSEKAEHKVNYGGVCIMSPIQEDIGTLWGTSLGDYHYEIVKLT